MRHERLVVGLVVVVAFSSCLEMVCGNYLSINPRATSGYGKRAAACLSTSDGETCRWTGWQSADRLKTVCPALACLQKINDRRYALGRAPNNNVVAVAAGGAVDLWGDLWLGNKGTALHCVDTTKQPGFIARVVVGSDRRHWISRATDPRCDSVGAVPPLSTLAEAIARP